MGWKAGSGLSSGKGIASAIEAARDALESLEGAPPTFGVVFASPQVNLSAVLAAVSDTTKCSTLAGCTTAGEFTQRGLVHGGVSILLVSAPDSVCQIVTAGSAKDRPGEAAKHLCKEFSSLVAKATARGFPHSTTITLIDGLAGTGERIVKEILAETRPFQQIVGGAAGDEGAFKQTSVGAPGAAGSDSVVALHVFGANRWAIGVDHGLRPQSAPMTVTRAVGNVIQELDHRPAFEAYRAHAQTRGIHLTPDSANSYLIANELGVFFLDELRCARAPLGVTPDLGLRCAADIPQGSTVAILDGDPDQMISAASNAAKEAYRALGGAAPAAVLVFDCVCRGMILGSGFKREIDAVRAVFPKVPMAGFLTYGEIARFRGRLDGWHNTTAVVVAIPE